MTTRHLTRKHSKYSASGAERWFSCQGSVALSEGLPDKDNVWSIEGTQAHGVLERILKARFKREVQDGGIDKLTPQEMITYAKHAADQVERIYRRHPDNEILIETRVSLEFVHPEAFGSLDVAVLNHFERLDILDFKYGFTHVSPIENLQFIFYALGVAYAHHWNFKRVRLWSLQPRVKGFDGYLYWDISMAELQSWVPKFKKAIALVERYPNKYVEGAWCHWCKAKGVCPLKVEEKMERLKDVFKPVDKKDDF